MQKLHADEESVSHWTVKCWPNSASDTCIEMQHLCQKNVWSKFGWFSTY